MSHKQVLYAFGRDVTPAVLNDGGAVRHNLAALRRRTACLRPANSASTLHYSHHDSNTYEEPFVFPLNQCPIDHSVIGFQCQRHRFRGRSLMFIGRVRILRHRTHGIFCCNRCASSKQAVTPWQAWACGAYLGVEIVAGSTCPQREFAILSLCIKTGVR